MGILRCVLHGNYIMHSLEKNILSMSPICSLYLKITEHNTVTMTRSKSVAKHTRILSLSLPPPPPLPSPLQTHIRHYHTPKVRRESTHLRKQNNVGNQFEVCNLARIWGLRCSDE